MTIGICKRCKKERLIQAKGLCASCYVYLNRNKEHTLESNRIWRKKNPLKYQKIVLFSTIKRALKKKLVTQKEIIEFMKSYKGKKK
jgi:hypothetical protein